MVLTHGSQGFVDSWLLLKLLAVQGRIVASGSHAIMEAMAGARWSQYVGHGQRTVFSNAFIASQLSKAFSF